MSQTAATPTVLIVEDDASIRAFASKVLELEGYHVLSTGSGDDCLSLTKQARVALVLLDLRLPGCDGWGLLSDIKSDPQTAGVAVIVFSASAAEPHRDKALLMGAADYLCKPVAVGDLAGAVAKALKK